MGGGTLYIGDPKIIFFIWRSTFCVAHIKNHVADTKNHVADHKKTCSRALQNTKKNEKKVKKNEKNDGPDPPQKKVEMVHALVSCLTPDLAEKVEKKC